MAPGKTQLPLCHLESETVLAGVICALFLLQSNHVDVLGKEHYLSELICLFWPFTLCVDVFLWGYFAVKINGFV